MLILLLLVLLASEASADTWTWDYDTTTGAIPPTAILECSGTATGPFATVATVPSLPSSTVYTPVTLPTSCRIRNIAGVSNIVTKLAPVPVPTVDPRIVALEAKLAGICRAAKAMGGASTTIAGRLRKEIPCL